jgi:hypothetical protein
MKGISDGGNRQHRYLSRASESGGGAVAAKAAARRVRAANMSGIAQT